MEEEVNFHQEEWVAENWLLGCVSEEEEGEGGLHVGCLCWWRNWHEAWKHTSEY